MTVEEYILQIKTEGAKSAQAELAVLDRYKKQLESKKVSIQVELKNIDQKLAPLKRDLKELQQQKIQLQIDKGSEQEIENVNKKIKNTTNEIKKLEAQKLEIIDQNKLKATEGELQKTTQNIKNVKTALRDMGMTGQSAGEKVRQSMYLLGAGLQSIGNAMENLSQASPFTQILQQVEGLVSGGITNIITEGISGITDRYDAIQQYKIMMEALGASTEETAQMTKKLDDSVQGLPTSLDEVMTMAKNFTATLGDYNKATDYAIAVNDAFLASGTDEMTRTQGMQQIRDLLSGKKLNTKEWNSLIASMSLAKREMGKVFGATTDEELRQFDQDLRAGKYSADEFLDALVKVTKESPVIKKALMAQKSTFQGIFQNITTAVKRLGEQTLTTLDKVFQEKTGGTLVYNIGKIRDFVDDLGKSLRSWATENSDKILQFFEQLKGIDWKGIISNIASFTAQNIKFKVGLLDVFSSLPYGKEVLGFLTSYGSTLGNIARTFGGVLAGLARISYIGKDGGGGLIKLFKNVLISPFLLLKTIGGKIKAIGPVTKAIDKIKGFISKSVTVKNVLDKVPTVDFATKVEGFKSFMMSIGKLAGVIGLFAGAGATIKLYVSTIDDIAKMEVPDWQKFGKVMAMIGSTLGAISLIGTGLGAAGTTGIGTAIITMGELATGGLMALLLEFATTVREYVKALDEISKLEMPSADRLEAVVTQIHTLNSKMVSIATNIGETTALTQFDTAMKSVANILANMAKSVATTHELAKENAEQLKVEVDKLSAKDGLFDQVEIEMEQLRRRAVLFMAGFGDQKQGGGLADQQQSVSEWASGTESTLPHFQAQLQTVVAVLESIKDFTTKIAGIRDAITSSGLNTDEDLGDGGILTRHISNMSSFLSRIKTSMSTIIEITEELGETQPNITALNSVLSALPTLFTTLGKVKTTLESSGLVTEGTDGDTDFFENLGDLLGDVEDIIDDINGIDTEGTLEKSQQLILVLQEIQKIFAEIAKIKLPETKEGEDTQAQKIGTALSEMLDQLILSLDRVDELKEKADTINTACQEIRLAITGWNGLNGAFENLQAEILTTVAKLATLKSNLDTTGAKVNATKTTIDNLKKSINDLPSSKTITINVKGVDSATTAISGLATAIDNLNGSTATVNVIRKEVREGAGSGNGGGGGGVFMPRNAFRNKFMERMSDLDIKGTLRALSIRAGMNARTTRISHSNATTTNKHYNNNATVNQYITTNNPNWAYRRASRYARQL